MMNEVETRKYEMLSRVREFGANHAAAFPSGTIAADLLAQIGATVDLLSMHSATKATGTGTTRQGSVNRAKTRDALRADLEAISRTARAIGVRIEGVEAKFKLPPAGRDQSLLDAARSFAVEAVPLKAEFELCEMPPTFITKLETDIAAFERALNVQRQGLETRVQAGAAIDSTLAAGMGAVRQLDSMVRNKFAGDPASLTAWARSSRVVWPSSSPPAAKPASQPAPAGPSAKGGDEDVA